MVIYYYDKMRCWSILNYMINLALLLSVATKINFRRLYFTVRFRAVVNTILCTIRYSLDINFKRHSFDLWCNCCTTYCYTRQIHNKSNTSSLDFSTQLYV